MTEERLLYDLKAAMHATSRSRSALYRAMQAGWLEYLEVGGRRFFTPEQIVSGEAS